MPCGRLLDQTSIRLVKDESDRGLGCGSAERTAEESAMGSRSLACALVRHRQAEPRGARRRRVFEAALQNGPKRDTRRRYCGAHTGSPRVSIDRTPAKGVTMSWLRKMLLKAAQWAQLGCVQENLDAAATGGAAANTIRLPSSSTAQQLCIIVHIVHDDAEDSLRLCVAVAERPPPQL